MDISGFASSLFLLESAVQAQEKSFHPSIGQMYLGEAVLPTVLIPPPKFHRLCRQQLSAPQWRAQHCRTQAAEQWPVREGMTVGLDNQPQISPGFKKKKKCV